MTDNPQIDPRLLAARRFLDEYAAALSRTSPGPMSHAARMLELLDTADETSGVRRVATQELAGQLELARAEVRQQLADAILPEHWQTMQLWGGVQRLACGRCRYGDGVRYLWPCPTRRAITGEPQPEPNSALLSAADSPVGGVS